MEDIPRKARLTMEERNVDGRNVRRRLFQDDDKINNEQLNDGEDDNFANSLFEEARQNQEDAKKRWNFDFKNETPLPGNYEWVKLDREGNEISDSVQANNGVQNSRERKPEKEESNTEETSKTENDK